MDDDSHSLIGTAHTALLHTVHVACSMHEVGGTDAGGLRNVRTEAEPGNLFV